MAVGGTRARTQILHKLRQIIYKRVMFAPILEPAFLNGAAPRVRRHGLGAIANFRSCVQVK